jgi:hypothetical protein
MALRAGIAWVVLFIAGLMTAFSTLPDKDSAAAKVASTYASKSDRTTIIIGSYLLAIAGLVFLWFVQGVRALVRSTEDGDDHTGSNVAYLTGVVFAVFTLATGAAFISIAGDISFGQDAVPNTDVARFIPELGFPFLFIGGLLAGAVMSGIVARAIFRSGALPSWLGVVGVIGTIGAAVATPLFFPAILFVIWILVLSIVGSRQTTPAT